MKLIEEILIPYFITSESMFHFVKDPFSICVFCCMIFIYTFGIFIIVIPLIICLYYFNLYCYHATKVKHDIHLYYYDQILHGRAY